MNIDSIVSGDNGKFIANAAAAGISSLVGVADDVLSGGSVSKMCENSYQ